MRKLMCLLSLLMAGFAAAPAAHAQLSIPSVSNLATNDVGMWSAAAIGLLNSGITGYMLISGLVLVVGVIFLLVRVLRPGGRR